MLNAHLLGKIFEQPAVPKPTIQQQEINKKNIWDDEEVSEFPSGDSMHDGRTEPEYSMYYRQSVATEDMYLGLSGKSHSIMNAEELCIKVILTGVQRIQDIELNPSEQTFDVRTSQQKLVLHLPHKVDSNNGSAKWDSIKSTLTVILPIIHEFGSK